MATDHQVGEQAPPPAGRVLGMIFTGMTVLGSLAVVIFFASR
jgi:hypothetical protein